MRLGFKKTTPASSGISVESTQTESSTNDSSQNDEEAAPKTTVRFFEDIKLYHEPERISKVRFGVSQIVKVESWKSEELWWSKPDLRGSMARQSEQIHGNDKVRTYLQRYQQAQEELQLSQIYNLDGKPHLEKLPGGLRRGFRQGYLGLEVLSTLENRRRDRRRAIVRSVVDLSSRMQEPMQLRVHSERLSAPGLCWAMMVAEASQRYERLLDI